VSGWDKFLSILPDIYIVLAQEGNIPETEIDEFLWVCENTCNFLLRTVDGNVLRKRYGNASGSGCTTRDNIFGHIIIFAAGLYSAYVKKNGVSPPYSLVFNQLVFLYGDDNVFSLDDEFSLLCDFDFLSQHLGKYGLKLKFFFGGLHADLHTLSFLGANFKLIDGNWYPLYDVTRLATTMVYEQGRLSLAQHLSKVFTLTMMSFPSEHYGLFKRAYANLVNSSLVQNCLDDPVVKSYAFVGVPTDSEINAFYLGQESSSLNDLMLHFSSDLLDII
jgi:hypothetical protein